MRRTINPGRSYGSGTDGLVGFLGALGLGLVLTGVQVIRAVSLKDIFFCGAESQ